jgi:hypothetical protein
MIEQRPLRPDEIARILAVDTTFHVHLRRGPHDVQNESFPTLLLARQRLTEIELHLPKGSRLPVIYAASASGRTDYVPQSFLAKRPITGLC